MKRICNHLTAKISILGISIITLFLAGCGTQKAKSIYTKADLVWEENFDGTELNTDDWNYEFHAPGWVNREWQSYDDSKENTYVRDGKLIIQPLKIQNEDGSYRYTSGRINTMGKHDFKYGRIEASIKMPKGKGYLPAFWMMPTEEKKYGQWPRCGEIDITEVLGDSIDTTYATLHFGAPHTQKQNKLKLKKGNFSDSFHVYAVEWDPGEMRFYCDGILYHTVDDWFTAIPGLMPKPFPAPFNQTFYIILNVAVGGEWPGFPDETTTFDEAAQMQVDYVRVYQKPSYDENVKKKVVKIEEPTPDKSGNFVKQGSSEWQFLSAGGGIGDLKVAKDKLTITSKNSGTLEYSVQVVSSNITLMEGKKYKYSFDAYSDSDRTIITGITAPEFNFDRRFGDVKLDITKEKQHFEFEFTMQALSDDKCRIEYNLGAQNSTATVYISNIRLERID